MGIPAFFRYFRQAYPQWFVTTSSSSRPHFLLIDANSIIYQLVHACTNEQQLIEQTFAHIEHLRNTVVQPALHTLVAFDGVAPFSKMLHQRIRRMFPSEASSEWFDTHSITPGTPFMQRLHAYGQHFYQTSSKVVTFLGPQTVGEGEQKLFQWLRHQTLQGKPQVVIYGVDADLMLLSWLHEDRYGHLVVLREQTRGEFTWMDAAGFLRDHCHQQRQTQYDLLCLYTLLGNDFLPRITSLSIQKGAIPYLQQMHAAHVRQPLLRIDEDGDGILQWRALRPLLQALADQEVTWLRKHQTPNSSEEAFIAVGREAWRQRYYRSLFFAYDFDERRVQQFSIDYLRGWEWTMQYYCRGCPDWRWGYRLPYAPLLQDIWRCTPYFDVTFLPDETHTYAPCTEEEQLAFVWPEIPWKPYISLRAFAASNYEQHIVVDE